MITPVAELIAVSHRYGSVAALTDLSISLQPGEITALLGPNGAGKTTAVSLLTGLTRPSAGEARLFGGAPTGMAGRRRMGVMLQVSRVPETLTVREHLHLFSAYYPAPLPLPEVLALAGLESVANRRFGKLSGGNSNACCSPWRSAETPSCSSSTSRPRAWTSSRAVTSGRRCASWLRPAARSC
ncbi:MAG: ATP-binding cassette domain-containing protein [Acidobacteriota bacterium]